MQIHVTEEARHICFAKSYLRERVPRMSAFRRLELRDHTPFTFAVMAKQMIEPPRWLLDAYGVPAAVRREAFRDDALHRARIARAAPAARPRAELGLIPAGLVPLWKVLGILVGTGLPAPAPARDVMVVSSRRCAGRQRARPIERRGRARASRRTAKGR